MRIMLDCRPLQALGAHSEKYRLIVSAVAALSGDEAIEWLLLADHTYRPGELPGLASPGLALSGLAPAHPGSSPISPLDRPRLGAIPAQQDLPGSSDRCRLIMVRGLPGPLGWKLWYDWQLPRLVKRHKPDWLMLTGGVAAKPSVVRQCVWMPVFANSKEAKMMPAVVPIYTSRLGNTLRQAESIFCFSARDRSWLAARGQIEPGKIVVVRPAPSPIIQPLTVGAREAIKQRYTGGKEYFFVPAAGAGLGIGGNVREEEIVQLLKAFSLFKKRQRSNLQLVFAGANTPSLRDLLGTYKYRDDIHWADGRPDDPSAGMASARPHELMSAAYAVLFPFEDGTLGTTLLNAWKAGVPALVARTSRLLEMVDDAAAIAGVDDPPALAGYLMAIYKDETGRNALIENGTLRLGDFDPSPSLAAIQTVVGREINKIN